MSPILKSSSKDFIIMIIVILSGWFIGIISGLGEPVWVRKKAALSILILSFLFFGFRISYLKERKLNFTISLIFLLITVCISAKIGLFKTKFNSDQWKSSICWHRQYDGSPSHHEGNMVEDIVRNKLMIGKEEQEVFELLGTNYFTENHRGKKIIYYFYSGSYFDGCDQLWIEFENKICINSGISGCD